MQNANKMELSSAQIQSGFRNCAYIAFLDKGVDDRFKPEFLQTRPEIIAGFQDYVISNPGRICEELTKIPDTLERICVLYGLIREVDFDYWDDLGITRIMQEGFLDLFDLSQDRKNSAFDQCVLLMLPTSLPFLALSDRDVANLNLFGNRFDAKDMLNMFYNGYDFPEATSAYESLLHLFYSFYFLGILLQQDCQDLVREDIEKFILFIKFKMGNLLIGKLGKEFFLQEENLGLIYSCMQVLLKCDIPVSVNIYYENKSLLLGLILDAIFPLPMDLNDSDRRKIMTAVRPLKDIAFGKNQPDEKQRLDICLALLHLEGLNIIFITSVVGSFCIDSLVELIHKIKPYALMNSSRLSLLRYLGIIMNYSFLASRDCSYDEKSKFFLGTKDIIYEQFTSVMVDIAKLFYAKPNYYYTEILQNKSHAQDYFYDSGKIGVGSLFIMLGLHKDYQNMFPVGAELLLEFHSIHVKAINENLAWKYSSACLLLKKIMSGFETFDAKIKDLDFITVRDSCEVLVKRSSDTGSLSLSDEDLVVWEKLLDIFPSMALSIVQWDASQKQEIDSLCLKIIHQLSFKEDNIDVVKDVVLATNLANFLSKETSLNFYRRVSTILLAINREASLSSSAMVCQIVLIKNWLVEHCKKMDECSNSEVLSHVKIFPRANEQIFHQLLYLCELSDILSKITQKASFFLREDFCAKVKELSDFILKERDSLYDNLKNSKSVVSDVKAFMSLHEPIKFLDKDFIRLLNLKIEPSMFASNSNDSRKGLESLAITSVDFSEDKVVFYAKDRKFYLSNSDIPALNILNARVYVYKAKDKICLYSGDNSNKLLLLLEESYGAAEEVKPLTDDELLKLFDGESVTKVSSKKSNKSKKKGKNKIGLKSSLLSLDNTVVGENVDDKSDLAFQNNLEKQSYLSSEEVNSGKNKDKSEDLKPTEALIFISWDDKLQGLLDNLHNVTPDAFGAGVQEIADMIENRFNFKVSLHLNDNNIASFSLGDCSLLLDVNMSAKDLWQDFANLPTRFFTSNGADSFANIAYDSEGKVVSVVLDDCLANNFNLLPIEIKKGDISKALDELRSDFAEAIQGKLKVKVSIELSKILLTLNDSSVGESIFVESCDLQLIKPDRLWSLLLGAHIKLLQQKFGGNIALLKLEFDESNNIMALNRSDHLTVGQKSLHYKAITSNNISEEICSFFENFDRSTFKLFKALSYQHVDFIIKIMKLVDIDLVIYGHPVISYLYGDILLGSGVENQQIDRLFVRLNYGHAPDVNELTDWLTSKKFGAILNKVCKDVIYYTYCGHKIAICTDPYYMRRSIFYGDRFSCVLGQGSLAYIDTGINLMPLGMVLDANSISSSDTLLDKPYYLKAALYWNKVMGKIGGGLRKILESLYLLDLITAPRLENITWCKTSSKSLLPGVVDYVQKNFHLSSSEDASLVVKELESMLQSK